MAVSKDSFKARRSVDLDGVAYDIFSLPALARAAGFDLDALPYSRRVLLENLVRHEDGDTVDRGAILGLANAPGAAIPEEIAFHPARVLMPDSSGGPLLVDLAAMRDALVRLGRDPTRVNPVVPVDFVVDHSAVAEYAGSADAIERNLEIEFDLNRERYGLIKWAQQALRNFRVVPPGNGILHQINLEYLARVVRVEDDHGGKVALVDTLVGMDSHTPTVNGLAVVGWGVGGIEAASVMLGEPVTMLVPRVVGCRLTERLRPGITATDLVLTLTHVFRRLGVVGCFVEFCGPGCDTLAVPDRATVANMAPEYGATIGFFPIDAQTIRYLRQTGRGEAHCRFVEAYARAQRLWRTGEPVFDQCIEIDLSSVEPSMAGPSRPQDRLSLAAVASAFRKTMGTQAGAETVRDDNAVVRDGDVVIAAITSCTNTSNPGVMVGAGLLARNALARGLQVKPWVKTSLSPGSRRVGEYLAKSGLGRSLDALGFQVTGYGCMTCMGSSGSLDASIEEKIRNDGLSVATVLSGNRNFEARIHPLAKANFLASPPLVVAYAIAGSVLADLSTEPLGTGTDGQPVFLRDIWPDDEEIRIVCEAVVTPALFEAGYARIEIGHPRWDAIGTPGCETYDWDPRSTYLRSPLYVEVDTKSLGTPIRGARILAVLGDNITTDHITPVGSTHPESQVGRYLIEHGVAPADFNSLSSRRANPDVVARTTYANVLLRNEMTPDLVGDMTRHYPGGEVLPIFVAANLYRDQGVPLVVIAGTNYGMGSSRDTAAKGVRLLGVRAVVAESFERIHRSNLIGMGVLPLEFEPGVTRQSLGLRGDELIDLDCDLARIGPGSHVDMVIARSDDSNARTRLKVRLDTAREAAWFRSGGIMPYVLAKLG